MVEARGAFAMSIREATPRSTPDPSWMENWGEEAHRGRMASSPNLDSPYGYPTSRAQSMTELLGDLRIPMSSRRWSGDPSMLLSRSKSPTPGSTPTLSPTPSRAPSPAPPSSPLLRGRPSSPLLRLPRLDRLNLRRMSKDAATHAIATVTSPHTYLHAFRSFLRFVISLDPSLLGYFFLSVSTVISNKHLLRGYFPFPWMLLGVVQLGFATIGILGATKVGSYRATRLSGQHETIVKLVAVLFSCEQLASILSLRMVTVPFHISVRALSPVLTLLLSILFFDQKSSLRTTASFLVILLGVVLTSHSIPDIHSYGSLLTFTSMILSSAKSLVTTHLLQDRYSLKPLDIVARISPQSMVHCLFFSWANGEMGDLYRFTIGPDFTKGHVASIALNGALAWSLVLVGIVCDKRTQAPAMAISGHASQAFTTIIATIVFGLSLSPLNFLGVALTLGGGALSAWNEAFDNPPPLPVGKILPD